MRQLGRRPTLGELQRTTPWVWLWCERCQHHAPLACAVAVILWGADASSDNSDKIGLPHLARPQCREALRRNSCRVQGLYKFEERRIDRFIGQLERAVMVSEGSFCTTIDPCLHCLGWVHVVIAHKPTRLVRTDRQNSELKRR